MPDESDQPFQTGGAEHERTDSFGWSSHVTIQADARVALQALQSLSDSVHDSYMAGRRAFLDDIVRGFGVPPWALSPGPLLEPKLVDQNVEFVTVRVYPGSVRNPILVDRLNLPNDSHREPDPFLIVDRVVRRMEPGIPQRVYMQDYNMHAQNPEHIRVSCTFLAPAKEHPVCLIVGASGVYQMDIIEAFRKYLGEGAMFDEIEELVKMRVEQIRAKSKKRTAKRRAKILAKDKYAIEVDLIPMELKLNHPEAPDE